jgi:hypothetical protein
MTNPIQVTRQFLTEILDQMEGDWLQIDQEFGPTEGGLDADIAIGNAEVIRKLRELLAANPERAVVTQKYSCGPGCKTAVGCEKCNGPRGRMQI